VPLRCLLGLVMERQHSTAELTGGRLNGGWGGGARLWWPRRLVWKREASDGGALGSMNRSREGKRGRGGASTWSGVERGSTVCSCAGAVETGDGR
jgi:hypothetical protein